MSVLATSNAPAKVRPESRLVSISIAFLRVIARAGTPPRAQTDTVLNHISDFIGTTG